MDYLGYVARSKSLVIAPAGYGKTYAIAECLKYTQGKQLVLTHTHAGVASLKEKILNQRIAYTQYRIETITSFAQKYVNAFYCGNDIPEQENTQIYFPFIIERAINLFKIAPIREVIRASYSGLFVDEYQDCTIAQHNLIKALAGILPTHIVGDYLQGIFDFTGDRLIDFEKDLDDFEKIPDLSEPWRWKKENPNLGKSIKLIRDKLEKREIIDLNIFKDSIEIIQANENDKYIYRSDYNSKIWALSNEGNVLIIHPDSTNINVRKEFTSRFNNAFYLVEAIDDKDFYKLSKEFDKISQNDVYDKIYNLVPKIFNGTSNRDRWLGINGVKKKTSSNDKSIIKPLIENIEKVKKQISFSCISKTLKFIEELPKIKCYRKELLFDLCAALEKAEYKKISVLEAMKEVRNSKRRNGRKIYGKCIGTTLLTKGLEFQTVAILDAHNFKCRKNFYVAISRACKRLVIFTENKRLSPYFDDF